MATQPSKAELVKQHPHLSEDELAEKLECSVAYVRQQRASVNASGVARQGGMNWKDPEIAAQLRLLWEAGHSCSVIARMLGGGVTRNSVIGAVTRAKLPRRDTTTSLPKARRVMGKHQPHQWHKRKLTPGDIKGKGKPFVLRDRVQPMKLSADPTPIPPPAADDVPRVGWKELYEDGEKYCRWPCFENASDVPNGAPLFCGLPQTPGSKYCPGHHARAYPPVRLREQQIPADSNVIVLKKRETVAA